MHRSLFAKFVAAGLAGLATVVIVGGVSRVADQEHADAVLARATAQPAWLAEVSCTADPSAL